jgi:hypothetical protein
MKNNKWLFVFGIGAVVWTFGSTAQAGSPVTRRGTSVLHYMTQNALIATEAGSNAVGQLRLQQNEQGNSSKQSLRLLAAGLEPNASYNLIAVLGDDTNAVQVASLAADRRGRSHVSYLSRGQGRGGKNPLPEVLNPLINVRSIGVENASTQTVAYAWIADAEKFQYIVKRNLTPEDTDGSAAGSVSLIANHRHVNFRLLAGGLAATNDYYLALNSNIVGTVQTGDDGRLQIKAWPTNAPAVLELHSLSLLDGSSNVVLQTRLPK